MALSLEEYGEALRRVHGRSCGMAEEFRGAQCSARIRQENLGCRHSNDVVFRKAMTLLSAAGELTNQGQYCLL